MLPKPKARTVAKLIFLAGLALALFFALRPSAHGQRLRGLPEPVGKFLNQHDDLSNFAAFFLLAGLGFYLADGGPAPWIRRHGWRLGMFLLLVVAIECGQRWIPGRHSDWRDVATGWSGILTAWVIEGWRAARQGKPLDLAAQARNAQAVNTDQEL